MKGGAGRWATKTAGWSDCPGFALRSQRSRARCAGDHADLRVRKKVFAYFLNNHHGDGIVSVCIKSALGENVDRAGAQPGRY